MKNPLITTLISCAVLLTFGMVQNGMAATLPVPAQLSKQSPPIINKTIMLRLINEVRKKGCTCGDTYYKPVPPLVWDDRLEEAAQKHSEDMLKNNYFSHIEADGSNGGVRIERAGYTWTAYAENVGMGYKTEKEVLEGWLKSPGHCKNLMGNMYKEVGVARAGNYWTQDFGSRESY